MISDIRKIIDADSVISEKVLRDQFKKLILQLLSESQTSSCDLNLVIIVNTLDKCEQEEDIQVILQLLASVRNIRSVLL